jgi:hypothetical protein
MKKYFLFVLALLLFTTSCKKCGDCINKKCTDFYFNTIIRSKDTGADLTGKELNEQDVKYLRDSIKYKILSPFDSTDWIYPALDSNQSFNFYFIKLDLRPYINDKTNIYGWYNFIFHLNQDEYDTLKVFYPLNGEGIYQFYYQDSLINTSECNGAKSLITILK